jgi:outer membrane immunogenic protein
MRHLSIAAIAAACVVTFVQFASAADLPVKAAPPPAPAPYSWTGFYIGANIGGGWGSRDVSVAPIDPVTVTTFANNNWGPPPTSFDSSGVIGGFQFGYNWQFNRNWLVGFETDFQWSDIKGSVSNTYNGGTGIPIIPITATASERVDWFGTVRARFGYLPMDNLLAYATGGFAYGQVKRNANLANASGVFGFAGSNATFAYTCNANSACFAGSSSETASGWTLGGGLEYAFWQKWTIKAEYLYVSLAAKSVTETALVFAPLAPSSLLATYNRTNLNVARAGINYHF